MGRLIRHLDALLGRHFNILWFLQWSKVPAKLDEFEIAQYDLVEWRPYTKLGRIGEGRNRFNKSVVAIDFTFQRQTGFFLLQVQYNMV